MIVNPDLHHDLVVEFIALCREDPKLLNRFILSGKEFLTALKKRTNNVDTIWFCYWRPEYSVVHPLNPLYMNIGWYDDVEIDTHFGHHCMEHVIRWALFSAKEVVIDTEDSLPTDVTDLLLKNFSFKRLELTRCDFSTAELLVRSRKFDYVRMAPRIFKNLNNVRIDTEELRLCDFSLEEIMKAESIKTNSLITEYRYYEYLSGSLFPINIGPGFKALKKLKLSISHVGLFLNPEKLLKFLELMNTKFPNLTIMELRFSEYSGRVVYNGKEETLTLPPNFSESFADYENKLASYDLPKNVCVHIHHKIESVLPPEASSGAVADYFEDVRKQLSGFDLHPDIRGPRHYYFSKSIKFSGNFKLDLMFCLVHYAGVWR